MSVEVLGQKRRKRRVAADEAHSWARNLRLGNPFAKLVLGMLTLYVNGDGACFVGVEQLADDTELSADTVRKRLGWLEQIGVVARFPRWIDAAGRCNSEGRGKRTSDEIRLLLDADEEAIEGRAKGTFDERSEADTASAGGEINPRSQQGLNPPSEPVSPRPALGQPSDSSEGLTSEPEPERSPPNPPAGGVPDDAALAERFKPFAEVYPAPITDMQRSLLTWSALTEPERQDAIIGAKGYALFIESERKRTGGKGRAVKDAHRWLAGRGWVGYLDTGKRVIAAASAPTPLFVAKDGPEARVIEALYAMARTPPPTSPDGERYLLRAPLTPQAMALQHAGDDRGWPVIEDRQQIAAWNEFVRRMIGRVPLLDEHVAERVMRKDAEGKDVLDHVVRKHGIKAPWPWPPRKDGSVSTEPPGGGALMTDDEFKDFK